MGRSHIQGSGKPERSICTILALSIETTRLGASWRLKDGAIRSCSLPLHDGTLAFLQVEQLVPQLVALAGADTIAVERDPAPAVRQLAAKVGMEVDRIGIAVLAKVTRSQAGRTVIGYGGTDRAEIRAKSHACGKLGDVAKMDDPEVAAAVMLVAAEAYLATSVMIDSVKAEVQARTLDTEARLMAQIAKAPATQPKRPFSSHIIDRGFEGMFGRRRGLHVRNQGHPGSTDVSALHFVGLVEYDVVARKDGYRAVASAACLKLDAGYLSRANTFTADFSADD